MKINKNSPIIPFIKGDKNKSWFTLVELIVVITILAILGTLGFVSYTWYSIWARDTNRTSSIFMIWKAMEVYSISNDLLLPENYVEIRDWSTIIAYQGDLSKNVLWRIWYLEEWLDPKDDIAYTYYVSKNLQNYQLMSLLEEPGELWINSNLLTNKSFASTYSERYSFLFWKKLWVFTDINNIALQNIDAIKSMPTPFIDISALTDTYKVHIGTNSFIEWTGNDLQILKDNLDLGWATSSCESILNKNPKLEWKAWDYLIDPDWGNAIVAFCDMTN